MSITVRYKTVNDRLTFEFTCESAKQAFAGVASLQELFEETACGDCGSADVVATSREHDGNVFYGLQCRKCGAQLDIGQKKDGRNLFIRRRDQDGNVRGTNGWYHWERQRDGDY